MVDPTRTRRQAKPRAWKTGCQAPEPPMAKEPQAPSAWAFAVGLSNLTLRGLFAFAG
jgi:hypothetical protein